MEIFKLFGSIFVDNDAANRAIDETDEKAEKTGGTFEKLGGIAKGVGGFIAAGVGVAAGAMGGLLAKTLETTNEIIKFSQVTGMSTEGFQKWDHAAKSVGFSMEAAAGDIAALAEKAMDAQSGIGENAEIFKELGVSVEDTSGKLKTQEQLFDETIKGLQGMEDVTRRNAIATMFLSTTGEELAPILNMTAEELENLKNSSNVISDEDLQKAADFDAKWYQLKTTLSGVATEIGIKLMPIFQGLFDWIVTNMPAIQSTMDIVFNAISNAVNLAVGIFKDYFLPVLSQLWSFIQVNLIPIFTEYFSQMQSQLPLIKEIFQSVFKAIWEVAKTVWAFFKNNIIPIFVSLYTWIQGHMPVIRSTTETVFNKIREVISMVWTFLKNNLLPVFSTLLGWVQANMPAIKNIIEGVFKIIANVVKVVWDIFENLLLPVLKALWNFIKPTFPLIKEVIKGAFDYVIAVVEDVITVFEKVTGAIQKAVDWLTFWDDKDPKPKTLTVTEKRTSIGGGRSEFSVGTNFAPGGMALVGERGPELVNLPRGSKVKTANQTRQMMGNTFNFEGMMKGANFVVRSDSDIPKIARELGEYVKMNARKGGVVF